MKNVVITGSTRGIGFGMADSFLARGCSVIVSGRTEENVERATETLHQNHPGEHIFGYPCDVRDPDILEALWEEAKSKYSQVDIWINNAGISGPQQMIKESSAAQAKEIVDTNLLGVIYGSQVAVRGMMQQGHGSIYNMEGMGSDGRMHDGLILYGMSKYGVSYFTRGLIKETDGSPLIVGSLRPGMVITDFIMRQFEGRPGDWDRAKRIFNIIADRVETVTPWLVDRILENKKHGAQISWASRGRLIFRFLTAPISRRNLFVDEEGV
jgi:NAD(P)-dependent dehydrogenase (short-subunit alcohol dehydrogenase family)